MCGGERAAPCAPLSQPSKPGAQDARLRPHRWPSAYPEPTHYPASPGSMIERPALYTSDRGRRKRPQRALGIPQLGPGSDHRSTGGHRPRLPIISRTRWKPRVRGRRSSISGKVGWASGRRPALVMSAGSARRTSLALDQSPRPISLKCLENSGALHEPCARTSPRGEC